MRITFKKLLCWILGHPFPEVRYKPNVVLTRQCPRCGRREFAADRWYCY